MCVCVSLWLWVRRAQAQDWPPRARAVRDASEHAAAARGRQQADAEAVISYQCLGTPRVPGCGSPPLAELLQQVSLVGEGAT